MSTCYSTFRFKSHALVAILAITYSTLSSAAGAARVDFATGNVMAVNAAGAQRNVNKGAEISNGEAVVTGDGGRAQLRFTDGALVSLQPRSEFKIDNYQYSGKGAGEEKGFFSLIKGGMRTITGLIGRSNRNNYQITTSVATIGIRGTEYTAGLNQDGSELLVHTGEGVVEVCNGAGCVLLGSGESGSVQGRQQPKRTDSRPQLPPAQPDPNVMPPFSTGDIVGSLLIPTSPMPTTGTATYSSILSQSGTNVQLSSVSIGVNFGTLAVNATLSGQAYASPFTVTGSDYISGNKITSMSVSGSGGWCSMSCSGNVSGTFVGQGAQGVSMEYSVTNYSSTTVTGAAIVTK